MVPGDASSFKSIIEQFICLLNILIGSVYVLKDDFSENILVLRHPME
jgi:hypothetical protein